MPELINTEDFQLPLESLESNLDLLKRWNEWQDLLRWHR